MRRFILASAPLALVFLATSIRVVAQDTAPSPTPLPSAAVWLSSGDLAGTFPTQLGDEPWQQLSVVFGPALFAGLDPFDPQDAERIAENQDFLRAANATPDDLTSVTAFRMDDDGAYAFISAYQIAGADSAVMADTVQEGIIASYANAMQEPGMDMREIAGRNAVVLWDEALIMSSGEIQPNYFYTSSDTVWVLNVDDSLLVEAFEKLPLEAPE